jgi:hypothetical protein
LLQEDGKQWLSAAIYVVGFFVAYAFGPILTKLDAIS